MKKNIKHEKKIPPYPLQKKSEKLYFFPGLWLEKARYYYE